MSLDMDENLVKVVLDTNILISAIIFGGKPNQVILLVLNERIKAITSPILLAELREVLNKKFPLSENDFKLTIKNIENVFRSVEPKKSLKVVGDEDDNRVLEAAIEGKCNYIVTGDKELLGLGSFKGIKIVTADRFLGILGID